MAAMAQSIGNAGLRCRQAEFGLYVAMAASAGAGSRGEV